MGEIMSKILVLGGNEEAFDGIQHIKDLGHNVILCDGNPEAISRKIADDFICANIYDEEEVVKKVSKAVLNKEVDVDGVMTIATDSSKSVAAIADKIGLHSCSIETADLGTDKFKMKLAFAKDGLQIPWFTRITSIDELKESIQEHKDKGFVLKPVDSRGARGIIRINKDSDLTFAFNFSIKYSKAKELILEEWLEGHQLSTESVIWDDSYALCGVADRNYSNLDRVYPYVVEDGGETPSRFSPQINHELNDLLYKAAGAIGLKRGTIKGDIVLTHKGLYIIEIAVRLSGGYFSTITILQVYGNDIIKAALDISLGIKPEFNKFNLKPIQYQANRFLFLKPGKIKKIDINLFKLKKNLIKKYVLYVNKGNIINKITNHTQRAGMVLCIGNNPTDVKKECIAIVNAMEQGIEIGSMGFEG